jgi:hypothetical protein
MPRSSREYDDDDVPIRRKPKSGGGGIWLMVGAGCGCLALLAGAGVVAVILVVVLTRDRGGPGPAIAGEAAAPNPKIKNMPGLVAYWSFDDTDGNKVIDHSGRGNHAKIVGARLEPGVRGRALALSGERNQYCELPATNDLNFAANAPFTFAGWFKTPLRSATILSLTSARGPQQIDMLVRDNRFITVVGDDFDNNVQNAFVWSNVQNNGAWRHFALARQGNTLRLWIDGQLQGQKAANSAGGPVTTDLRAIGSERVWIVKNDNRWGNPAFEGLIDEVCVFNRVLEQGEVQMLMER